MPDTKEDLICPACGKIMKKVFLADSNINIDICVNGCGGIFFDNRELEKVDDAYENASAILNETDNKNFNKTDTTLQRTCPACGMKMLKMGAGKGGVQIDVCATCGGKFLDAGELQSIRNATKEFTSEKMCDTLEQVYQQNIDNMSNKIIDKIPAISGYEKRREFFSRIVSRYI